MKEGKGCRPSIGLKRVPRIDFRDQSRISLGSAMTIIHMVVEVSCRGVKSGTVVAASTGVGANIGTEGVGHVCGWEVWVGRAGMGPDLVEERDRTSGRVDVVAVWGWTGEGCSPDRRSEGNPTGHWRVRWTLVSGGSPSNDQSQRC